MSGPLRRTPVVHPLGVKHVQAIHAIVLTGSVTGAAERLHVTQPALSNRLRDAEERLGFDLFQRRGGRLVPHDSTMLLFDEIERSFVGLQHINSLCERIRQKRRRRLAIACTPVFAAAVLPSVLAAFRGQVSDLFIAVESRSAEQVAALVASGKADVGFGLEVAAMPGLHSALLATVPMLCYLGPQHPLARRGGTLHAQDLLAEPMLSLSRSEGVEQVVANAFHGCGGLPPAVLECPAAVAACSMAGAGLGFVVFDPLPAAVLNPALVAVCAFEPAVDLVYRAYRCDSRSVPAEYDALVALASAELARLCAPWKRASR